MKNYFKVLNVSESADIEVIKAAYKALVKKYHPDNCKLDKAIADKKMIEINEAYSVLKDDRQRREHLEALSAEVNKSGSEVENDTRNKYYEDVKKEENPYEGYEIKTSECVFGCLMFIIICIIVVAVIIFVADKIGLLEIFIDYFADVKENVNRILSNFKM